MPGSKIGGLKAAQTNRIKHGENFYADIGRVGGSKKVPKGFALMPKSKVRAAGKKGGSLGKRGKTIKVTEEKRKGLRKFVGGLFNG